MRVLVLILQIIISIRVKASGHAVVRGVSYFLKEQRVKPLKTWKPQSISAHAVFKMAIRLLITAHRLAHKHTRTHEHVWLHLRLLYQHCDESHKADQAALLQRFCIIASLWRPHTKSGRKAAVNPLTVCWPLSLSHLSFLKKNNNLFSFTSLDSIRAVCFWELHKVFHATAIKVLKQVDT